MAYIKLSNIDKQERKVSFDFSVTEGLTRYFSNKPFWIEYPENIEQVPDAILAVPFVCNVLPIIWITDSTLFVPELDEAFYNCLPNVKKGYEKMYPETNWRGAVEVGRIVPNTKKAELGKSAMFYSGGVDSVQTLISHLEEKPILISVWGSDIKPDNVEGWEILHKAIEEATNRFQLNDCTIRSTFREFDDEGALTKVFHEQLKDGWWHGVKHGLGLLGHVAPLAYLYGLQKVFIASSNSAEDRDVRCASNPIIDNHVRYANCMVIHDGFEYNRQRKIANIVDFANNNQPFPLHVCWKTQTGTNCCQCEKCFRTIIGLMVEKADPLDYGFGLSHKNIGSSQRVVLNNINANLCFQWIPIKEKMYRERAELKGSSDWKYIKWVLRTDFEHPERIKLSFFTRFTNAKGFRGKLGEFKFYQALHRMKVKMNGK